MFNSHVASATPKSILDTQNLPKAKPCLRPSSDQICVRSGQEAIGLALIDAINEEENDGNLASNRFRYSKLLKVQIPAANNPAPADFGIKTTRSGSCQFLSPTERSVARQLSWKEMELSEDYTCVISHGPNPTTTHIFDDCIVESCAELEEVVLKKKEANAAVSSSVISRQS